MAASVLPGRLLLRGLVGGWYRGLSGVSGGGSTGTVGLTDAILREKSQQQASEEGDGKDSDERQKEQKQKESTAYAKKMVLRLAGLMGIAGAGAVVYVFEEKE